jgi:transposase InsO family protein
MSSGSVRQVNGHHVDVSCWPLPDEGAMGDAYFSRKKAVTLYLGGETSASIKKQTEIGSKQAYRLIRERCLQPHPDGREYGWRGLIPYLQISPYRRKTKIRVDQFGQGAVGAMRALLEAEPLFCREFEERVLSSPSAVRLGEVKRTRLNHTTWFLGQLRQRGYEHRHAWPFNTKTLGYNSICRFIDETLEANPRAAARLEGGKDLVTKLSSGDGVDRPVKRFLQRVEMDAHKLDGRFSVALPLPEGGHKEQIIHRLWVIVIIDVYSRLVLGYHLSLRREVSKDDVMRAIQAALSEWKPRKISFSETPYAQDAGFLSADGSEFTGLCWDEMSVDGALAETCKTVKLALSEVVKSTLIEPKTGFSKRRNKDDRPFVEAFFRTLSSGGFQRLSNTTGAKPKDKKGVDPDKVALASSFQYEYAEELLDVLIANYNGRCHHSLKRSPLAFARFCASRDRKSVRQADTEAVQMLLSQRKKCRVQGGAEKGRTPYVNCFGARYSGAALQNRYDLVGQEIWVVNHIVDDARVARASTMNGGSLGILRAAPPWHASPHSLAVRAAINSGTLKEKLDIKQGDDAVESLITFVEQQPHNKLPVHVAYLEARRILTAAAELAVGESMLEQAQERAEKEKLAKPRGTAAREATKPVSPPDGARPLPARRMTASS